MRWGPWNQKRRPVHTIYWNNQTFGSRYNWWCIFQKLPVVLSVFSSHVIGECGLKSKLLFVRAPAVASRSTSWVGIRTKQFLVKCHCPEQLVFIQRRASSPFINLLTQPHLAWGPHSDGRLSHAEGRLSCVRCQKQATLAVVNSKGKQWSIIVLNRWTEAPRQYQICKVRRAHLESLDCQNMLGWLNSILDKAQRYRIPHYSAKSCLRAETEALVGKMADEI